jgi:hypothetical protein
MTGPVEALDSLSQKFQELAVIHIVLKDPLAAVSPRGDVIDGARKLNAQRPRHHPYPKAN